MSGMFPFFLVGNFEFLGVDLAGYRVITTKIMWERRSVT